jgi:RNA polymerase sigma-70 factor (ECF subfamily)
MASFADIHLDSGIARGLKRGDRRAQTVAYQVLSPTIMGMAVRILQDEGLAQEVLQDTFVELIDKAGTLKDPDAVVAWVRRVAVNHCYMRLRSPWNRRRSSGDSALELLENTPDAGSPCERMEGQLDIERALATLPPETRMVIWLHDVEGYTHREIGDLTGQTASYSKSQLSRGYVKLMEMAQGKKIDGSETDDLRPACSP